MSKYPGGMNQTETGSGMKKTAEEVVTGTESAESDPGRKSAPGTTQDTEIEKIKRKSGDVVVIATGIEVTVRSVMLNATKIEKESGLVLAPETAGTRIKTKNNPKKENELKEGNDPALVKIKRRDGVNPGKMIRRKTDGTKTEIVITEGMSLCGMWTFIQNASLIQLIIRVFIDLCHCIHLIFFNSPGKRIGIRIKTRSLTSVVSKLKRNQWTVRYFKLKSNIEHASEK